ncbi:MULTISPECIES: hypothetical protein [Agrobacterium]|uniref:Uncharacterized protein n=1 Tax=Agrobacterium larrymoorei TaxID=160699 RepID=A0ABU0UKH6_9HYPH|nr:hypothetical protein [Agrobacterium larrymoorei]MDQ1185455.1 hypothetical protein [Agrobacterium larrymoorei]MDQ1197934.1 hypothetical protein [Rhizobium sp. SORGH_AS_0787]
MKTLSDLFQAHSFDYELVEDDVLGTIGIFYPHDATPNVLSDDPPARDVLRRSGAVWFYFCLYVPRLTEEEVLALFFTGNQVPNRGEVPATLPSSVFTKFFKLENSEEFGLISATFSDVA